MKPFFKKFNKLVWKAFVGYSIAFLLFATTATHIGAQVTPTETQKASGQTAEADTEKQLAALILAETRKFETLAAADRAAYIAQHTYIDPKLVTALPKVDQNKFIAIQALQLDEFKAIPQTKKQPLIASLSDVKKSHYKSLSPEEADRFLMHHLARNTVLEMSNEDKQIIISRFSPETQKYLASLPEEQRDEYLIAGLCWKVCDIVGGALGLVNGLILKIPVIGDLIGAVEGLISGCSPTRIDNCFKGLAKAIATTILKNLFKTVFGTLFHIIFYIVFWLINITVLPFGLDLNPLMELPPFEAIRNFINDLTPWAYNDTSKESAARFNLFTIVDAGIGSVYSSIPNENPGQYLAATVQNNLLGIETASAQGVGTQSFTGPIQKIWQRSQQLALILMVLVLVAMGFMIMFRRRLSPQVSVTVLNSIPRVALALILITFSFAISGLFIDLAYVGVNVIRNFYGLNEFNQFFVNNAGGELIWIPVFTFLSGGTVFDWTKLLSLAPFSAVGGTLGLAGAFAIMLAVVIIEMLLRLTLFAVSIYLFWILLKNFALMIVYTILSPFFFMMGAVPGFESVTINWAKRMLANALLFPLVVFFLYLSLGFILGDNFVFQVYRYFTPGSAGAPNTIQAPPPLGTNLLNISFLIGLGVLFFATKLPTFLEKVMKLESFDIRGGVGGAVLAAPLTIPYGVVAGMGRGNPIAGYQNITREGRTIAGSLNRSGWSGRVPNAAGGTDAPQPIQSRTGGISRAGARLLRVFIPQEERRWQAQGETPAQRTARQQQTQTDAQAAQQNLNRREPIPEEDPPNNNP